MGKQLLEKTSVSSMPPKNKEDQSTSDDDDSSTYLPVSPASRGKGVTFGSLKIRSHAVVLGDHPCCSAGCPLELSWDYESETEVSLDDYETRRPQRRSSREMRTTWLERRELLSELTDGDVRRATRLLQRSKRASTDLSSFFAEV